MASIDLNRLCLGCMNLLPQSGATCPNCGWSKQLSQNSVGQLKQETHLKNPTNGNEYIIGKSTGKGGFGIVYIAWDVTNNRKVAVKEYFPMQFVTRNSANTVLLTNKSDQNFFDWQKKRFKQEAEKMKLFNDSSYVVNVFDSFEANDTAYIVMEFIEGQTFMDVLSRMPNSRLPLQTVLSNLKPLTDILERIHHTPWKDDNGVLQAGIIHRDISPENIMYPFDTSKGTIKLLDFGAARVSEPGHSLTTIRKPGYAPYEQEVGSGQDTEQGPWTDVYALAATIYRAITGILPPDSVKRYNDDKLRLPSSFGIPITPAQEQVLLKGLAVKPKDRYKSVRQFFNDLMSNTGKAVPVLTVGNFTKNGDIYVASVKYSGDGVLTSNIGYINGGFLYITGTGAPFSGVVTASEGAIYSSASVPFAHNDSGSVITVNDDKSDTTSVKFAWAVAAVAVIVAVFSFGKISNGETELNDIRHQIEVNQTKLEKYQSFAADYGYASSSYYAKKAVVFVKKNAEIKVEIYCDLLRGADTFASIDYADSKGKDLISIKWEDSFNVNTHTANVIVKAGKNEGFTTLKFSNTVNSDSFDVLVVVQ